MRFESIYPFLLIIAPFAFAFLLEAFVIGLFRLKRFWSAIGSSVLVNLLSLCILYGSSLLLGSLGYELNGLRMPIQALIFLWWLSIIVDGLLLQLFTKGVERKAIYLCSIVMNTISYLFLYFFITYSR